YDRRYRYLSKEEIAAKEESGEPFVIRLAVPLELIVRYIGGLPEEPFGVASYYLCEEMQIGDMIEAEIRSSIFHDIHTHNHPVIFLTAGVGIASFIGWIFERSIDKKSSWLIFGDRDEREDFIYQETWIQLSLSSHFKFSTAFSRKSYSKPPCRLEHLVMAQGDYIWDWIEQGALVLIAGSIPMGQSLINALQALSKDKGNESWMSKAIDSGQFRHELY
ncbi:hypothetical protein, partial [Candidatus Similichlamydia epinepheli]|uniref:hypothetical protein n=1 Tax=Candidatus Similichlamydia epinepheli TaxID=1903953 RepID=UPI001300A3FF